MGWGARENVTSILLQLHLNTQCSSGPPRGRVSCLGQAEGGLGFQKVGEPHPPLRACPDFLGNGQGRELLEPTCRHRS